MDGVGINMKRYWGEILFRNKRERGMSVENFAVSGTKTKEHAGRRRTILAQ